MTAVGPREVLTGHASDGTRWVVTMQEHPETGLHTSIVFDGHGGGGFGGPPLHAGERVNWWVGRTDDLPAYLLVRTDPRVVELTANYASGRSHPVGLVGPIAPWGLLLGAHEIPAGEELTSLAEADPHS